MQIGQVVWEPFLLYIQSIILTQDRWGGVLSALAPEFGAYIAPLEAVVP